jgi:C4-dicarboxylate transporter DctM subunit
MMLGFPEWIVYTAMVPPMVLTAVIALVQTGLGNFRRRANEFISLAGLIFACMLVLMAIRVPIAISMFVAGVFGYLYQVGTAPFLNNLNGLAYARFASYDLSVIPLFILMGNFATQGGISKALFQFASVMARFRGGLAMAAVMASAAFGAICGSSIATAATITSVALPEMKRHGYSGRLATGTLAAGGTLGILIPPSVPLVIYAILTEQNIAKLFAAATIPGIIAMCGYMIAIAVYVRLFPGHAPEHDDDRPRMSWRGVNGRCADCHHLHHRVWRHLWRPVHAHRGRGRGRGGTFVAALHAARAHAAKIAHCFYATAAPAP